MKAKEIREMTSEELEQKILDTRQELFNLNFQHSSTQLENTSRIKLVKKDIARLKTIYNEKKGVVS